MAIVLRLTDQITYNKSGHIEMSEILSIDMNYLFWSI